MENSFSAILSQFSLDAPVVTCDSYGFGHINRTYLVVTQTGCRYILQKINDHIFKDVPALMANIAAVTDYLRRNATDPHRVLTLVRTLNGESCLKASDGSWWRVYDFVEDSVCLQAPESPRDFYQSAVAFGQFQQQLKDFPAHTLHETIRNFHNTVDRYRIFREVLEADPQNRAASVQSEIAFALARESEAGTLLKLLEAGKLPLRVTHNDTKLNNIMLDAEKREPLCVIDLDTVMPGLAAYDFGDSIRFGASTAPEDEQDLSLVTMDLSLFRTYAQGFISACPDLMELEKETLPMGAKLMTLECGVRFLTDYLDGDHYFAVHRDGQNLDRCRTQFKLVADMESKWDEMMSVIRELS